MTGKMALQIVLDNSGGCTEKLAMTRAWGDRYRAEATGYMRRKAYYFKRNFWAMNIHWKVWESHLHGPYEEIYVFNDEKGQYESGDYYLPNDPMDFPPASEANKREKKPMISPRSMTGTKKIGRL